MSDVLKEAHQKHLNAQKKNITKPAAAVPFNPIQAYADQLPAGSRKPRGKRR